MELDLQQVEYIARILLAGICGMFVGIERKNRAKEAGVRTHFVVACGAALMMVVSKYAFFDLVEDAAFHAADIRLDPSRVASTIASGIGFLGAGMIIVYKNSVSGLTTAAGIWATSGIGMAIGAGLYAIGISATFIILTAQIFLHLNFRRSKKTRPKKLSVQGVCEEGYQKYITDELERLKIHIQDVSVDFPDEDGSRDYTFTVDMPLTVREEEIIILAKYKSRIESC